MYEGTGDLPGQLMLTILYLGSWEPPKDNTGRPTVSYCTVVPTQTCLSQRGFAICCSESHADLFRATATGCAPVCATTHAARRGISSEAEAEPCRGVGLSYHDCKMNGNVNVNMNVNADVYGIHGTTQAGSRGCGAGYRSLGARCQGILQRLSTTCSISRTEVYLPMLDDFGESVRSLSRADRRRGSG